MAESKPATNYDEWILTTAPRAVAYARSLLVVKDQAEDIVQDCYCRLLAKKADYDLLVNGTKILYRAISNACINANTRRKPMVSLDQQNRDADDFRIDPEDRNAVTAVDWLNHQELSAHLAEALQTLPDLQRAAIELKALGYTQQEVAEILETTPSNAGVLIHRGRLALSERLKIYLTPNPE